MCRGIHVATHSPTRAALLVRPLLPSIRSQAVELRMDPSWNHSFRYSLDHSFRYQLERSHIARLNAA